MNKTVLCIASTLTGCALLDIATPWWVLASSPAWGAIGAEVNSLMWAKAQALAAFNWGKNQAK